jgi:hypothetical protein
MAYPTLGKAAVAIAPSLMIPLLPVQFIGRKKKNITRTGRRGHLRDAFKHLSPFFLHFDHFFILLGVVCSFEGG